MFTPFVKSRTKDDVIIDLLVSVRHQVVRSERNIINAIHEALKEILDASQAPAERLILKIGPTIPK